VLSGLGYIVWFDVATNVKQIKTKRFRFRNLSLHSKLTLCTTLVLLTGGALLFMIYEYSNPNTLASLSFWDKLQVSLFQSMTCRTAGFVTIPQENLSNPSALVSMMLMFIGGSPVGTAGGVKTVTMLVIFSAAFAALRNQKHTELFNRRISTASIQKAVSIVCVSGTVVLVSTLLLSACCSAPFLDVVYETVSACATVGITRGVTAQLNTLGKLIIIGTMFLGRVGPISLALAFSPDKRNHDVITSPVEEICIG
jgi:trk system potassium uptake protein TrkH